MANPIRESVGLLNRWALDSSGRIVPATQCVPEHAYRCPECDASLTLRRAHIRTGSVSVRAHLAHAGDLSCPRSGESAAHLLAKKIVAQRFNDWLSGVASAPFLGSRCACGIVRDAYIQHVRSVQVEGTIGNRRADILILRDGDAVAIEICATHPVDAEKASDLRRAGAHWIELSASDVLQDPPGPWTFTRCSRAPTCPCIDARRILDEQAAERMKYWEAQVLIARDDLRRLRPNLSPGSPLDYGVGGEYERAERLAIEMYGGG